MQCSRLHTNEHPFDAQWLPGFGSKNEVSQEQGTANAVAVFGVGVVSGHLDLYDVFGNCIVRKKRHNGSLRSFRYFDVSTSSNLVSVGSDGTALLSNAEGQRIHRYKDFKALNKVEIFDQHTFVMGDDEGAVHFVDTRVGDRSNVGGTKNSKIPKKLVRSTVEQEDFISVPKSKSTTTSPMQILQ